MRFGTIPNMYTCSKFRTHVGVHVHSPGSIIIKNVGYTTKRAMPDSSPDDTYPDINEAFWKRQTSIRNTRQDVVSAIDAAKARGSKSDNAYENLQHRNVDNTHYGPTLGMMQTIKGDGGGQREMPLNARGDTAQGSCARMMGVYSRNAARTKLLRNTKVARLSRARAVP
jgi:hypothetical protein